MPIVRRPGSLPFNIRDEMLLEKPKRKIDFSKHKFLCKKAGLWLRRYYRYGMIDSLGNKIEKSAYSVVLVEPNNSIGYGERPDTLGIINRDCCMVECKTSRSDFLNDFKKYFRRKPEKGVGNYRYYLTYPNIIKICDLPQKWGLLYLEGKSIKMIKHAEFQQSNNNTLNNILYSYCLKLQKENNK